MYYQHITYTILDSQNKYRPFLLMELNVDHNA